MVVDRANRVIEHFIDLCRQNRLGCKRRLDFGDRRGDGRFRFLYRLGLRLRSINAFTSHQVRVFERIPENV